MSKQEHTSPKHTITKILSVAASIVATIFFVQKNSKRLQKATKQTVKNVTKASKKINKQVTKAEGRVKKSFKELFKDFAIPHEGNNHRPKGLQPKALASYVVVVVMVKLLITGALFVAYPNHAQLANRIADDVLTLTNQERTEAGLDPYSYNPTLEAAAKAKVTDMVEKQYFAHISPDGAYPWQWIDKDNYNYAYMGENLAMDFSSAEIVHSAFMNSPSHRDNILHEKYTDIGIAVLPGELHGKETIFLAQFFGKPIENAAPVAVATQIEEPEIIKNIPQEQVVDQTSEKPDELAQEPQPAADFEPSDDPIISDTETESAELLEITDSQLPEQPIVREPAAVVAELIFNDSVVQATSATTTIVGQLSTTDTPSGAQLVVVEHNNLSLGLTDLLINWSRNFTLLMLFLVSSLLLVNILIKVQVQHTRTIVHCLLVVAIITSVLFVRIHLLEKLVF